MLLTDLQLDPSALSAQLSAARVLVVGDVMLDRYWFGDVNRISPEAPVPVAQIRRIEERAGGAANVARNIARSICITDRPAERHQAIWRARKV